MPFLNLYQHIKNQFIPLISSWDRANFRVLWPDWTYIFITTPIPTFFNDILISINLYHHANNEAFSSICSRDLVDWEILHSEWPWAFWPKSQKTDFYQIWNLAYKHNVLRTIQTKITDEIHKKINGKSFIYIQRTLCLAYLWPIYPFCRQNLFPKTLALSCTKTHVLLTPCWVPENAKEPIPRKLLDRRIDRPYS